MRLLIAEDDRALAMFLTRGMEADGHRVRCATDGAEAVSAFVEEMPDLTILDLNLPVMDGEQALREMRAVDPQLPVLVLTGRQEVETRIRCLDLGADDLMVKPFSLHELRARCRALLRRKREAKLILKVGDLELDRLDHTAKRAGEPITLTNKEFALMEHLMLHRGQCVSRVELLDAVWNMEPAQTTNIVDVYVNYLRRKLKDPPPGFLLRTVRGQGYLVPSETEMHLPVPLLIAQHAAEQASGQVSGQASGQSGTQLMPVALAGAQSAANQQMPIMDANDGQLNSHSRFLHREGSVPEPGP
jgi:DNA-binding response OmpR family regulator